MTERLVIDDTTVYEIDEQCMLELERGKRRKRSAALEAVTEEFLEAPISQLLVTEKEPAP